MKYTILDSTEMKSDIISFTNEMKKDITWGKMRCTEKKWVEIKLTLRYKNNLID